MIHFTDIPSWWPVCYQSDCPQAAHCLRYQACMSTSRDEAQWSCILPNARKNGECNYFREFKKVRMARGFAGIYKQLKSRDARHDIRIALTDYFGSKGSYYRYKDGERLLNPVQQQWILNLLARHQMTDGIQFDEYIDTYDFTAI
jgi:hypothetical protein